MAFKFNVLICIWGFARKLLFESDGLNSQRLLISSPTLCCCESTLTASLPTTTYSLSFKVRPLRGRLILVHRRRPPLLLPFTFETYQHLLGFFVVWTTLHWDGLNIVFKSLIVWQPSIFRWLNLAAIFVYYQSSLAFSFCSVTWTLETTAKSVAFRLASSATLVFKSHGYRCITICVFPVICSPFLKIQFLNYPGCLWLPSSSWIVEGQWRFETSSCPPSADIVKIFDSRFWSP